MSIIEMFHDIDGSQLVYTTENNTIWVWSGDYRFNEYDETGRWVDAFVAYRNGNYGEMIRNLFEAEQAIEWHIAIKSGKEEGPSPYAPEDPENPWEPPAGFDPSKVSA